jgi:hypothetical protein
MKKIFLLAALSLTTLAAAVHGQEKGGLTLGVGPVAALPLGDAGDAYTFGIGGEVQAAYGITDNIAGFVQAGYTQFLAKSTTFGGISIDGVKTGSIPALIGARYHNSGFMVGVAIGYEKLTASGEGGGFAYSPQLGYSFGKIDLIANYTGASISSSTFSYVGLKVIFNFLSGGSKGGW